MIDIFIKLKYTINDATILAKLTHVYYIEPSSFHLYNHTIETLEELKQDGWQHVILSNHVPELAMIVERIGLNHVISQVISSANIGYEKPHPKAFEYVMDRINYPKEIYMVGDNFKADIIGAKTYGIEGILIHGRNEVKSSYHIENITKLPNLLTTINKFKL